MQFLFREKGSWFNEETKDAVLVRPCITRDYSGHPRDVHGLPAPYPEVLIRGMQRYTM